MAKQAQRYCEEGLHDLLELVNSGIVIQEVHCAASKWLRVQSGWYKCKAAINYEEALDRQLQERRADLGVKKKSGLDRICNS
jgi:hypothetical protein